MEVCCWLLLRYCFFLNPSSFSENFKGQPCKGNKECENLGTLCDDFLGHCRMPPTEEVQNRYFECFVERMDPVTEVCGCGDVVIFYFLC